jgi:DNA-binding NarL/FixJ family response regulator
MTASRLIRVLCVDDHPVVRTGLRALIAAEPTMTLVGEAASATEAIEVAKAIHPDVMVVDVRLGDGDGIGVTRTVSKVCGRTRVLILTTYIGDETIHCALDAGATGFVSKAFADHELISAILAVANGRRYFSADVAARLIAHGPRIVLTARERAVLTTLGEGLRNKQIGARLGMTEATARTHVERILAKFNCRDRGRAVAIAHERGFFDMAGSELHAAAP